MKRIFLALAVIATLTGCASHLDHGMIIGKQYNPQSTYVIMSCILYTKYGCSGYIPIPITDPQSWQLNMKDGDKTGSTEVDQQTYDRVKVGQKYP